MVRRNEKGQHVATIHDMPYGFVPCQAEGCNLWYNIENKYRQGYCNKHEHLKPQQEAKND